MTNYTVEAAKEALIDAILSPAPYSDGLRPLIDALIATVRADDREVCGLCGQVIAAHTVLPLSHGRMGYGCPDPPD